VGLSHLFELNRVQIRGNQYGWVNTDVDCLPGMPLEIQASGSIDFNNFPGWGDEFTPDGDPSSQSREGALGWGSPYPCQHGQLVARIGHSAVFPVGVYKNFHSRDRGPLFLGHNDTKKVDDNGGAFEVRVCMPVQAIRKRPQQVGGNPGVQLTFELPGGISGHATVQFPRWMTKPNPRMEIHDGPAHPTDPARGVFCTPLPKLELAFWKIEKYLHFQL
jgi:hypothetical protein